MRILVTGGQGQLGIELSRFRWPTGVAIDLPTRSELDICDEQSVQNAMAQGNYAAVINAAAYTAVDKAEAELAAAFAGNAMGPAHLAAATKAAGIPLVHISTDYVFDGSKKDVYLEDDPVRPLGAYGASKEAGEQAVRSGNPRSAIIRTAWVVSPHRQNFVKTMLRLGADRPALRVVDDQHGCPTAAADLAYAAATVGLALIQNQDAPTGTYHFVNGGSTTWCGLARHVFAVAGSLGMKTPVVEGITTADYPTPARRPENSRLSTQKIAQDFGIIGRPWQDAITEIVGALVSRDTVKG